MNFYKKRSSHELFNKKSSSRELINKNSFSHELIHENIPSCVLMNEKISTRELINKKEVPDPTKCQSCFVTLRHSTDSEGNLAPCERKTV